MTEVLHMVAIMQAYFFCSNQQTVWAAGKKAEEDLAFFSLPVRFQKMTLEKEQNVQNAFRLHPSLYFCQPYHILSCRTMQNSDW